MKHLLLLIVFIFPLFSEASGNLPTNQALQSPVIETTTHLKQELSKELKQSVGIDEFYLKVELILDEKKIQSTLGVNEEDWKKLQGHTLPGLFVEGKEGHANSPLKKARKEDILMGLKGIKVNLTYHQDNYSPEFLTSALKKIVAINLPQLKEAQIEVASSKEAAPYRLADKPVEVSFTSEFANFWNEYHKHILISIALILLSTGFLLSSTLKGGLGSLSDVIKAKNFGPGASTSPSERSAAKLDSLVNHQQKDWGANSFESYIQANEYLSSMVMKEPKIFNEIIVLKLIAEDFVSVTILLDVLPKDKREAFLANIEQDKKDSFKQFIVGQGTAVLQDETSLKEEAIKMIKLVKVAALSPDELYQIVFSDMIHSLGMQELQSLIKASEQNEKGFICDMLDSNQLAYLIQHEGLAPSEIDDEVSVLSKSELVDLLIKASGVRSLKKVKVRKDKLESVYAQIETTKGEILADAMGLAPHLRFEFLFTTFKSHALKYIEDLDFESLALLFPLMTEAMRQEVLDQLPELLSERLKFAKKRINAESLKLKGDFYFYLRSFSAVEENTMEPAIELIAA